MDRWVRQVWFRRALIVPANSSMLITFEEEVVEEKGEGAEEVVQRRLSSSKYEEISC